MNKEHSIGDFEADLDVHSLNSEQQKELFPQIYSKGGPVLENVSDQPSAEWNSQLEDSCSQDEIKTTEIKDFFPDYYQCIADCEDEVKKVGLKQMVKIQIK